MKKPIIALFLFLATPVFAGGGHHGYSHHHRPNNYHWVAPTIIGGALLGGVYYYSPYHANPPIYYPTLPIARNEDLAPPVSYFCEEAGLPFPQVQSCFGGWLVVPAPPY